MRSVTVSVGMSKREVKRLLGAPGAKMSDKDFLRAYRSVAVMGRMAKQEHWMYHDRPRGHSTMITFRRGRVVDVVTQPTG